MNYKLIPKEATDATKKLNEKLANSLPFENTKDFDDAHHGFMGTLDTVKIVDKNGKIVWNLEDYNFIKGDCPDTVNPSLWRTANLNMTSGLYKVTDRVYQVRGFDLANITIIEGETGLVITDSLVSVETAQAALDLYYQYRPKKPVLAVIITHSHADHYGGIAGLISKKDVASGKVKLIVPEGFMKETVSENIFAGNAMIRRAEYMYGSSLERGIKGQVDAGLGKTISKGTLSLIPPNDIITQDHEKRTVDGIEIEFMIASNTEAPAEHMIYYPQFKLIDIAEVAVHTLHNIVTLRGAQVRDSYKWWKDLDKVIRAFGGEYEICIGEHHWPTWGNSEINDMLTHQRDMYKYIHDQTLHFINKGYTSVETAEAVKLPRSLEEKWYLRGNYGSLNHNVKAVYQFYLGWYSGNPAELYPLPPEESAKHYIEFMGGMDEVIKKSRLSYEKGDYRWVAEIMKHAVFCDAANDEARALLADALEQLGYQSESGPWRNVFLSGASELRHAVPKTVTAGVTPDVVAGMPFDFILDYMGIRLNAERSMGKTISMNWELTDVNQQYLLLVNNSVLVYRDRDRDENADLTLTTTRATVNQIFGEVKSFEEAFADGSCKIKGNAAKFNEFAALLDEFNPVFNIVTP